jgi:hypothetical protein
VGGGELLISPVDGAVSAIDLNTGTVRNAVAQRICRRITVDTEGTGDVMYYADRKRREIMAVPGLGK